MSGERLATWGTWVHPIAEQILAAAGIESVPISSDDTPAEGGDFDALYVRAPHRATREVMQAMPSLRAIAVPGAGLEIVDLEYASECRIPVLHGKGLGARAVAEWAVGAMIWLARDFGAMHRAVLAGRWNLRASVTSRRDLGNCTVGIIGYGHIGSRVAQVASRAFGSRVVVTEPQEEQRRMAERAGCTALPLQDLLEQSDIVSVHAAAAMGDDVLLDRPQIDRIGSLGYLVNTSRGQLVDVAAVADALDAGTLGGAALDVFSPEPPPANVVERLAAHPRVLLSPHTSGMTDDAVQALAAGVAASIVETLEGGHPVNCANPEVWA